MSHFVFSISDVTKVGVTLSCKAEFRSKRSAKCMLKIQLVLSHRVFCSAVLRLYAWAKGMWEFRNALNGSLDWFRRVYGEQIWIPKDNSLTGLAFFSFYLLKPWHIHTFFTYLLVKTDSRCTSSWLVLVCREIDFFIKLQLIAQNKILTSFL